MNKILVIVFLLIAPLLFGQGAATPDAAWYLGVPNAYWFELDTLINASGDGWDIGVNAANNSNKIFFNTALGAVNRTPNANIQSTFDASLYYNFFFPEGCSSDFFLLGYEEWYVLRVPSSRNIKINLDISMETDPFVKEGTTIQWYQFDDIADITITNCNTSGDGGSALGYDSYDVDLGNDIIGFELTSFEINSKYILLRVGNNDFGPGPLTNYKLTVSTKNNSCENALELPISDVAATAGEYVFSSTTNSAIKELLSSTVPTIGTNPTEIYGAGDYTSNTNNGTWFKSTIPPNSLLYAATCGSLIDPQLLIFDGCPTSNNLIAAEDQNIDNLTAIPPPPGGDVAWNRDVCLQPSNNPDWPLIKFLPDGTSTYYFFLYGEPEGKYNIFLLDASHENNGGAILPVSWLDFNGKAQGGFNQLFWATGSESQNDYFILEKSPDGEHFKHIAKIDGAGNASFENHYSFIDERPYPISYYRISQVDYDGTQQFGATILVENESISTQYSILDNPVTSGRLEVKCSSSEDRNVAIELYALNGQKVYTSSERITKGESFLNLSLNEMNDGIYIIKIHDQLTYYTYKIAIQSTK